MRLNNIIVYFREDIFCSVANTTMFISREYITVRSILQNNCNDNGVSSIGIGRDVNMGTGRQLINGDECKLRCLRLRD